MRWNNSLELSRKAAELAKVRLRSFARTESCTAPRSRARFARRGRTITSLIILDAHTRTPSVSELKHELQHFGAEHHVSESARRLLPT